jgi:hypothetical protein
MVRYGNERAARIAGLLYLMFIIVSILADIFSHIGFGDAESILNSMITHNRLFRVGFIFGMFAALFFLFAAWFLYVILKTVNKNIALLFVLLNLGGVIIQCLSTLNLIAGMTVLSGADYLQMMQPEQLQAQAMLFINLYKDGFNIAQIFYGAWTFPLGYLIFKSGFIPKILGIFLMIDCFAILIYFLQHILLPDYTAIATPCYIISAISEFSITLWLLIKGVSNKN